MADQTNTNPCPLAVMEEFANDEDFAGRPMLAAQMREARAAVAELVEALKASDEWVRAAKEQGCKLPCENTLRNNRAALAKFGGAA